MSKLTFTPVIGLEIHVQLATKTKIFCSCSTDYIGAVPNTNVCPACLGLPGSLPSLNGKAVEYGVRAGLALNCTIREATRFHRKNYFYADLPKAYQISQYDLPIAEKGYVEITTEEGGPHKIRITRLHLEEDAGKLVHGQYDGCGSGNNISTSKNPVWVCLPCLFIGFNVSLLIELQFRESVEQDFIGALSNSFNNSIGLKGKLTAGNGLRTATARSVRFAKFHVDEDITIPLSKDKSLSSLSYLFNQSMNRLRDVEQLSTASALIKAGRPVLWVEIPKLDAKHLGGLIYFFEFATALTGGVMDVNPFDQPGVEQGKHYTYGLMERPGYQSFAEEARGFSALLSQRTIAIPSQEKC